MKGGHFLLIVLITGAVGLGSGFATRRMVASRGLPFTTNGDRPPGASSSQPPWHTPIDSLETLTSLPADTAYARTAAWLATAGSQDIGRYWQALSGADDLEDGHEELVKLTLLNWARRDPRGAIAALKGGEQESLAWEAWGASDPEAALEATLSGDDTSVRDSVARGIGAFQPQWLLAHRDSFPAELLDAALGGVREWGDSANPGEMIGLFAHAHSFEPKVFIDWVRQDPISAYDWLASEESRKVFDFTGGGYNEMSGVTDLVNTLSDTDPESLQRLIDRAPTGRLKRWMEDVAFEKLLASDPDAALKEAQEVRASRTAAKRLNAVGLKLAQDDPARAAGLVSQIIAIYPPALGSEGENLSLPQMNDLIEQLTDRWSRAAPEDAARWLDASELPTATRDRMQSLIRQQTSQHPGK